MHVVATHEDLTPAIKEDLEFFLSVGVPSACRQGFVKKADLTVPAMVRQSFLQDGEYKFWSSYDYRTLHIIFRRGRNQFHYAHAIETACATPTRNPGT